MDPAYFHCRTKPFSLTPNPKQVFLSAGFQSALLELGRFIDAGEGISVVTSAPGLGKTLLLRLLAQKYDSEYAVTYLPTPNYATRADLLQAILFELHQPYTCMREQELRLRVISALRNNILHAKGSLILIDEAHLLPERLLDELRGLMNFMAGEKPLYTLVLAGSLKLEEKLTSPLLDAFNQRLRQHLSLEPLSRQEAINYLSFRLLQTGSNLSTCFQDAAVELILHAADGSPHAINLIAQTALEIGYVLQRKPVSPELIIQALEQLQKLPGNWSVPQLSVSSQTSCSPQATVYNDEPTIEIVSDEASPSLTLAVDLDDVEPSVFEFGATSEDVKDDEQINEFDDSPSHLAITPENHTFSLDSEQTTYSLQPVHPPLKATLKPQFSMESLPKEQPIVDAYANLDYKRHLSLLSQKTQLPMHSDGRTPANHFTVRTQTRPTTDPLTQLSHDVADLLDDVQTSTTVSTKLVSSPQQKLRTALEQMQHETSHFLSLPHEDSLEHQDHPPSPFDVVMPEDGQ